MLMTEYETTVVMRPDLGGDAVETTLDRVRDVVKTGGGKLLAINHWGKKKLSYEVTKNTRGIYVHTQFLGGSGLVAELERNLRISDNVLRYLTIKVAERVNPAEREEKEYVKPSYEAIAEEPMEREEFQARDRGDRERGDDFEGEAHEEEASEAREE